MTSSPVPSFDSWDDETFERELDRVTRAPSSDSPVDELELVAAAVHLAAIEGLEAPPAALMDRLRAQAQSLRPDETPDEAAGSLRALPSTLGAAPADPGASAPDPKTPPEGPSPTASATGFVAWAGWLVAAGVLAIFLVRSGAEVDPSLERDSLLALEDTIVLDWTATDDPLAGAVSGDVVWSNARQSGIMRFRDLAPNDPNEIQYQLWIFDGSRPDSPPVDGGVFDVGGEGEVLVPIDAKLGVGAPTLFAVTVERPGGVVVSDQEHIVVVAEPTKG